MTSYETALARRSPRGRRATTVITALIATLVAGISTPASAQPPSLGSGTGTVQLLDITVVGEPGPNVIQERSIEGTVSGTLEGTYTEHVRGVIHPNGTVTFHGTMHFTGTVEGCGTGTLHLAFSGRGTVGDPITEAKARVIDKGNSTLGVRGVATLWQAGPNVTYEVRYVCP